MVFCPVFNPYGIYLWGRHFFKFGDPKRGDVVLVEYKGFEFLKRIFGLPGDTLVITKKHLYVKGNSLKLPYKGFM